MLMETVLLIIRSSEYTKTKPGEMRRPVQPFAGTRLPNPSANLADPDPSGAPGSRKPQSSMAVSGAAEEAVSGAAKEAVSGAAKGADEPKKRR